MFDFGLRFLMRLCAPLMVFFPDLVSMMGDFLFEVPYFMFKAIRICCPLTMIVLSVSDVDVKQEPVSKFSGSLFDSSNNIRDSRPARVALLQERQKAATKAKAFPAVGNKQQGPAAVKSNFPTEANRFAKETKEQVPAAADGTQPPLKVTHGHEEGCSSSFSSLESKVSQKQDIAYHLI